MDVLRQIDQCQCRERWIDEQGWKDWVSYLPLTGVHLHNRERRYSWKFLSKGLYVTCSGGLAGWLIDISSRTGTHISLYRFVWPVRISIDKKRERKAYRDERGYMGRNNRSRGRTKRHGAKPPPPPSALNE